MSKPLDEDWNDIPSVNVAPTHGTHSQPKQAKGGVFAPSDMRIIKEALVAYAQNMNLDHADQKAVANLLHRLNNRT